MTSAASPTVKFTVVATTAESVAARIWRLNACCTLVNAPETNGSRGVHNESAGDLAGDERHSEHGHTDPRNGRGLCDDDETAAQAAEQHPPGKRTVPQQSEETSARSPGCG